MPERTFLRLFGVPLRVDAEESGFWERLSRRLAPPELVPPFSGAARTYEVRNRPQAGLAFAVRCGRRRELGAPSADAAADLVAQDAERFLARRAKGLLFVHAGAVAWKGGAILLPGRSGAGKSELVAALLRAGAEYLSDEFAVLDEKGRVRPYARPLVLRRAGGARFAPGELGAAVARGAVPVASIAFLRYRPGAPWRPEELSAGGAVLGLLRFALAARTRLELARGTIRAAVAGARAVRGWRGEAEEAARELLR